MQVINAQEYEYAVEVVYDRRTGAADTGKISEILNTRAKEGWRFVAVVSNEIGKNALGVGGFAVNSTDDQTVLVFERKIKVTREKIIQVSSTNIKSPFFPMEIAYYADENMLSGSLLISVGNDSAPEAIHGTLIVKNTFGEEKSFNNVYFDNFVEKRIGRYIGEFSLKLSGYYFGKASEVTVYIDKYVIDGKVISLNADESVHDVEESVPNDTASATIVEESVLLVDDLVDERDSTNKYRAPVKINAAIGARDHVVCTYCNTEQRGNRSFCYKCAAPFQYLDN